MFAQYEAEGNEREMRKYRSITDGPYAAELLDDLKKSVYETRDKVNISQRLKICQDNNFIYQSNAL